MIARLWEAIRFRWQRAWNSLNSAYWRAFIARRGGLIGSGLVVKRGAFFEVAYGGQVAIGENVTIAEGAAIYVATGTRLRLSDRVFIGRGTIVVCNAGIEIDEGAQIAHRVTIIDSDHRFDSTDKPLVEQGSLRAPIRIGKEAWVGAQAIILKGVTIGDRGVVGAAAVVTRSVKPGEVVVGNPARPRSKSGADR